MSGVVREIRDMERERNITVFTAEEYTQLRRIIERRNFWCHCCYFELPFDRKTVDLTKVRDIRMLFEDLRTAEQWREELFRRKIGLLKESRQT